MYSPSPSQPPSSYRNPPPQALADAERLRQFFEAKLAGERASAQRQVASLSSMLTDERAALDAAQRDADRHRFEAERLRQDLGRLLAEADGLRALVSADQSGLRRLAEEGKAEAARERQKRQEAEASASASARHRLPPFFPTPVSLPCHAGA